MQYYPIVRNWSKIKKHLDNKDLNRILNRDFNKFTYGRWREKFPSNKYKFPRDIETSDWEYSIPGRHPEYFNWVKHSACHWLVNFNLKLAQLTEPKGQWRIITSQEHSTVWDGKITLFDFNFSALRIDPNEAFHIANKENIQLKIGELMKVYFAKPYWIECNMKKPKDWNSKK